MTSVKFLLLTQTDFPATWKLLDCLTPKAE